MVIYVDLKFCFSIEWKWHRITARAGRGVGWTRGALRIERRAWSWRERARLRLHSRRTGARAGCQSGRALSLPSLHLASHLTSKLPVLFARAPVRSSSLSRRVSRGFREIAISFSKSTEWFSSKELEEPRGIPEEQQQSKQVTICFSRYRWCDSLCFFRAFVKSLPRWRFMLLLLLSNNGK